MAAQDPATFAAATAAGPALLARVLETAIADGKSDLAAVAVLALAKVTDRAALAGSDGPAPSAGPGLVGPGPTRPVRRGPRDRRRWRPTGPSPAPAWSLPTLARFIVNQPQPRAVVIDGNPSRGGLMARPDEPRLSSPSWSATGSEGFLAAAESADVELILVSYDLHYGDWKLTDTLANLQADARTAGRAAVRLRPVRHPVSCGPTSSRTSRGSASWCRRPTPAMLEKAVEGPAVGA